MSEKHLVNFQDYWKSSMKPRGFDEFVEMIPSDGRIRGIWELTQWDPKTGEVRQRQWNHNVVTDNGAVNILASAIANASNANPWNCLYINNNSGSSTLTSATGTGAITTGANLSVAALPAQVPLNYPTPANAVVTQLTLGYGTGTTQTISMNATTAQAATALNIVGFTPTINFPVGTAVVPLPNVAENPNNANLKANQSSVFEQYSGVISSGGFTYSATTGAGNRNVKITYVFSTAANGGSTSVANYTDCWLLNTTSSASNATSGLFVGNYVCHEINAPMRKSSCALVA